MWKVKWWRCCPDLFTGLLTDQRDSPDVAGGEGREGAAGTEPQVRACFPLTHCASETPLYLAPVPGPSTLLGGCGQGSDGPWWCAAHVRSHARLAHCP